jgi:hypothetical protein
MPPVKTGVVQVYIILPLSPPQPHDAPFHCCMAAGASPLYSFDWHWGLWRSKYAMFAPTQELHPV